MKTILSLFDYTGNWSRPYRENGYNVIQIDIQHGQDILTWDYTKIDNVYGILAAVPCTIENILLADREEWKNKANKYDSLVERIKEALDFVKTGKDADSKVKTECLENILKLIEEE